MGSHCNCRRSFWDDVDVGIVTNVVVKRNRNAIVKMKGINN
ncbi:hypothetical protein QCI42_18635 [Bacillus fungorum]